jgi:hypothetical protein
MNLGREGGRRKKDVKKSFLSAWCVSWMDGWMDVGCKIKYVWLKLNGGANVGLSIGGS